MSDAERWRRAPTLADLVPMAGAVGAAGDALSALLDAALDVDESAPATATVGRIEHGGAVACLEHGGAGWLATVNGARTLHPDAPSAVQHLADRLLPDADPPAGADARPAAPGRPAAARKTRPRRRT